MSYRKIQDISLINTLPQSVSGLPVLALADEIASALSDGNVLLRAEPGAGKSTGLPLALLFSSRLEGKIILLEPRRLAARSVAERLAQHLGEAVGQTVGLRMRGDTRTSKSTRLEVVTEGVLTRLLQADPGLEGVSLLIFDEFHERSLHADLGLALSIEVQQALREDLRLLLMSATLELEQLSQHLQEIKQFHCQVRQHDVEIVWVGEHADTLPQRIVRTVLQALAAHEGDVLVFLPGVAEINRSATLLQARLDASVTVHRLHGGVDHAAQKAATAPASTNKRRVILATSLAETSITINGVTVVIDSGLERRARTDSSTGAQRLETVMASQASATQRAGRAGRTQAGTCYRLWNETGHARRPGHWQAEIHRADLTPLLLELGLWGASSEADLPWLEPPPAASLSRAVDLAQRLGLWESGKLTSIGKLVAGFPVHPRLGHMLLWAAEQGVDELACRLAVQLDERLHSKNSVDLEPGLSGKLPSELRRRAQQLESQLKPHRVEAQSIDQKPPAAVVLAQAFPDWIAKRRSSVCQPGPGRFQLACGAGAMISEDDPLAQEPWLVVAELGGSGSQARIFKAMSLDIEQLRQFSATLFCEIDHVDWDDRQERVLAERRLMIERLVVRSWPLQKISDSDRSKALLKGIRKRGLSCLPWSDDCREWQARVQRMSMLSLPRDVGKWPAVDDDSLIDKLDDWLLPWIQNLSSIAALQQLDLLTAFHAMLDYPQQCLLEEYLPRRYTVPSGSSIKLSYLQTGNPVLSVRLQEMLGTAENPSIAGGQIPLKVELLSPAKRPVQITEDLANFWHNSYPAVKKEMAGRYPKHFWPDDPLKAQATTRVKPR